MKYSHLHTVNQGIENNTYLRKRECACILYVCKEPGAKHVHVILCNI